jgi:uncharacterized protein YkwD
MPHAAVAPRASALICLLALLGCGAAVATARATAAVPAAAMDADERALCRQINHFRIQHGVRPLRMSYALTRAASWMSRDMAGHGFFDHVDSRGRDFVARIRSFGYKGRTMGENLAAGDPTAAGTFTLLKHSPEHRRNMLRPQLRVIGVGRAEHADTTFEWYWTTTFGAFVDRSAPC